MELDDEMKCGWRLLCGVLIFVGVGSSVGFRSRKGDDNCDGGGALYAWIGVLVPGPSSRVLNKGNYVVKGMRKRNARRCLCGTRQYTCAGKLLSIVPLRNREYLPQ